MELKAERLLSSREDARARSCGRSLATSPSTYKSTVVSQSLIGRLSFLFHDFQAALSRSWTGSNWV